MARQRYKTTFLISSSISPVSDAQTIVLQYTRILPVASLCQAEEYELGGLISPFLKHIAKLDESIVLVSDETLQTQPASLVTSRIARYFPQATILISIRNQSQAIQSHYTNESRLPKEPRPPQSTFVSFRSYIDFHLAHPDTGFFRSLDYLALAEAFTHYFRRTGFRYFYSKI